MVQLNFESWGRRGDEMQLGKILGQSVFGAPAACTEHRSCQTDVLMDENGQEHRLRRVVGWLRRDRSADSRKGCYLDSGCDFLQTQFLLMRVKAY